VPGDMSPTLRRQVEDLAKQHPARSVRREAERLLEQHKLPTGRETPADGLPQG
jgi:hypothetical protein